MRNSGNEYVHDEIGFKYFCFSNLYPFRAGKSFEKGQIVNLLISSPRKEVIYAIAGILTEKRPLQIGGYLFEIVGTNILTSGLLGGEILITATPINISIPLEMYEKYSIKSDKSGVHWTNKMPLNAFVESLEHNSIHKYEKFFNLKFETNSPLFRSFKFKNFALVSYNKAKIAASYWELEPNNDIKEHQKLFNLIFDTGLGQRNGAGFGFVNIKK